MSTAGEAGTAVRSETDQPARGDAPPAPPQGASRMPQEHVATPRPVTGHRPSRRVRLTVSRVDPWATMKISFLLSIALGIAGVVMTAVLWTILAGMGAFDEVNRMISTIVGNTDNPFDLMDFLGFGRVVSMSVVVAVVDVLLITAFATLGAFLYNVCASLVGGFQMTLTDD